MKGKSQIKRFLFKINHKHLTISLLKSFSGEESAKLQKFIERILEEKLLNEI